MRGLYACSFSFNTQPPEGGWSGFEDFYHQDLVSTHSRLKAAGIDHHKPPEGHSWVSTHSRLKAAGDKTVSSRPFF